MSLQTTIKRYTLIIEKLERNVYPSAAKILDDIHGYGFEISGRSLQRDIAAMRNEFGIDIKYNKHRNGYYINKENTINFESFVRFLEIVNTANILIESIREGKEVLKYISFDAEGSLKGVEYLKQLLAAVQQKNRISFQHFNFQTGQTRNYVLEPYLLKQYENRWYVVGKLKEQNKFRTFGIDRIENVIVLKEQFVNDKKGDLQQRFSQVVGLNFSEGKREIVKIAVRYPQANYFKTLPLHTSQEIESETKDGVIFSLLVIPNFELIQKILIHVEWAIVLEPKWLADDLRAHLQAMLKNYK